MPPRLVKEVRCAKFIAALAALLVIFTRDRTTTAATISWASANDGNFATGASWTGGVVPGASDTAQFNVLGQYLVSFSSQQFTSGLSASNGTVLFGLDGHTYDTGSSGVAIGTTSAQSATLQLFSGTLTASGAAATIGSGGSLQTGKLIVDSGATLSGFSALLATTTSSTGVIQVQNGGQLLLSGGTNIASAASATGTLTVVGSGSMASITSQMNVGLNGAGTVNVQNDAVLDLTGSTDIGSNSGSSGNVTLSGSGTPTWNQFGTVFVSGSSGSSGTVTLSAGSSPVWNQSGGNIFFGNGSGIININGGQLNVTGNNNNILVASSGSATMTVASGGTVTLAQGTAGIAVNGNGTLNANSGGVINTPALTVSTGTVNINPSGTIGVTGDMTLSAGTVRLFSPGPANLTVGGTLTHSGGTLEIDAGSLTTVNYTRSGSSNFVLDGGTMTVTGQFSNGTSAQPLNINGTSSSDHPTLVLSGPAATTANIATLNLASVTPGALTIQNGAAFSDNGAIVGINAGGVGTVNVTGAGSKWSNFGAVSIGQGGTGTLTISAGGNVTSDSLRIAASAGASGGSVSVTGAGSTLAASNLYVGGDLGTAGATGSMTISSSASVSVLGLTEVWNSSGTALTITNGGALTTHDFTRLGALNLNDGTLTVSGGTFNNGSSPTNLIISGAAPGKTSNLQLTGAVTSNILNLTVGFNDSGPGAVNVNSALLAIGGELDIGSAGNSTGIVTLSGNLASVSAASSIILGNDIIRGASGTLTIGPFTQATAGSTVILKPGGTINLNGGTLAMVSFNAGGGVLNFNSGTIRFTDAATLGDSDLTALMGSGHSLSAGRTLDCTGMSLTIGGSLNVTGGTFSGLGTVLTNAGTIVATGGSITASLFESNSGSLLQLQGTAATSATALSNLGEIQLIGGAATIAGGTLTNNGGALITGSGTVNSNLTNQSVGTVRANFGDRLVFTGATNTNSGNFDLVGGTLEFRQSFTNNSSGAVQGYGNLMTSTASPGGLGITNNGVMQFSGGNTNIRGDVNNASGSIYTAGGTVTTFFDDVTNNGSIFTNAGARTVFFGGYSGAGSLPGGGTNEFVGDTRPGNSPASIQIGGNAVFDSRAHLLIEIGGLAVGTQYDKVNVAGQLSLGGTLNVSLINGFKPSAGSRFDIMDWGSLTGTFSTLQLPTLSGRIVWDSSHLYEAGPSGGTLSVAATYYAGDINRDSIVDVADISAMMSALTDLSKYQTTSNLDSAQLLLVANLNNDNFVNNADIQGLINLLANNSSSGSLTAVPEPTSLMLVTLGLLLAPIPTKPEKTVAVIPSRPTHKRQLVWRIGALWPNR